MGSAPAPGAVFRALAENSAAQEYSRRLISVPAPSAGREGASSDARGGRAPLTSEVGVNEVEDIGLRSSQSSAFTRLPETG